MTQPATALPFALSADALGYDEYTVVTRTSPEGQWKRAWTGDADITTSPAVAQQWLDHFTEELADDLAEAMTQLQSARSDSDRAGWKADIALFHATEYRIVRRAVTPFAPID
jgi:hypothetical protein